MSASNLVQLRGGSAVPLAAVQLLLNLEVRGFCIRTDDGALCISPGKWLTDSDRAEIQCHRADLLALVTYCGDQNT
jgi:hypothetical protein